MALGLHEVAEYYYYPGWHEPGAMLEFIVNQDSYDALPADLQAMVIVASRAANQMMLDEYTARNNAALRQLVDEHGVKLRRLPDDVIVALARSSDRVMQDLIARDPMSAKIYESFKTFYDGVRAYHHISEQAYINARDLTFEDE